MRIFSRIMAAVALLASTVSVPAFAEEMASAKMQTALRYMDKFVSVPEAERSLVWMAYKLKSRSQPASDIQAWYTLDGKTTYLNLNDRGELVDLPSLSAYEKNPVIQTNVPKKDMVLALRVRPRIELTTHIDASLLRESMAQANRTAPKISGMFGFLKPKVKGYDFEVRAKSTAELVMANGEIRPIDLVYINPAISHFEIDASDLENATEVRLSAPPDIIRYID